MGMRTLLVLALLLLAACDDSQERLAELTKVFPAGSKCEVVDKVAICTYKFSTEEREVEAKYSSGKSHICCSNGPNTQADPERIHV
jgi:hypothetical protein